MAATPKPSTLSSKMLQAIARTLSDHDLLRFMLSSKEALDATLEVLSTVDSVNYHDQNFEEEPCIALKSDGEKKFTLGYITESNPLFTFIVNFIKQNVTKLAIGDLVDVKPWVLKALASERLHQLTLGVILPHEIQLILKQAQNLTEVRYTNFDVFFANPYTAIHAKKVIIDYINFADFNAIFPRFQLNGFVYLENVKELVIGESRLFIHDYDICACDFKRKFWKIFFNLFDFFPSLKSFEIHLSGVSNYPMTIFQWFKQLLMMLELRGSVIEGSVYFEVLLPPNKWLDITYALRDKEARGFSDILDEKDEKVYCKVMEECIKKQRFPVQFKEYAFTHNVTFTKSDDSTILNFYLSYYGKWNEFDINAENKQINYGNWYSPFIMLNPDYEFCHIAASTASTASKSDSRATLESLGGPSIPRSVPSLAEYDNLSDVVPARSPDGRSVTDSDVDTVSNATTNEDLKPISDSIFDDEYELEIDVPKSDTQKVDVFYETESGCKIETEYSNLPAPAPVEIKCSETYTWRSIRNFITGGDALIAALEADNIQLFTARAVSCTVESQSACTSTSTTSSSYETSTSNSSETETTTSEAETTVSTESLEAGDKTADVNCIVEDIMFNPLDEKTAISDEFSSYSVASTQSYHTADDEDGIKI